MAKQIQKDRYLELDGTPVEAKGLWRHVSPLCLAATFATAALCSNYYDAFPHKNKNQHPITPMVEASLGLLFARGLKEFQKYSYGRIPFNRTAYDKYIIDTKKTTQAETINPADNTVIKKSIWGNGYAQGGCQSFMIATYGIADAISSVPLLYDCITHVHRLHKLNKGDWIIIDRNDMKKVEEEQKQENHSHTLAPAV